MRIRIDSVLAQSKWLVLPAACFSLAFSAPPADRCVVTFQESGEVPDNTKVLVGHWRKTTIGFVGPGTNISSSMLTAQQRTGS